MLTDIKTKIVCYGREFRKTAENSYPQKIFAYQLITLNNLQEFKKELLEELLKAIKPSISVTTKKWLKSHEVRRLLKISPRTLQTLKSSGVIPYTKIGGIHFYDHEDIQRIMEAGKVNNK